MYIEIQTLKIISYLFFKIFQDEKLNDIAVGRSAVVG